MPNQLLSVSNRYSHLSISLLGRLIFLLVFLTLLFLTRLNSNSIYYSIVSLFTPSPNLFIIPMLNMRIIPSRRKKHSNAYRGYISAPTALTVLRQYYGPCPKSAPRPPEFESCEKKVAPSGDWVGFFFFGRKSVGPRQKNWGNAVKAAPDFLSRAKFFFCPEIRRSAACLLRSWPSGLALHQRPTGRTQTPHSSAHSHKTRILGGGGRQLRTWAIILAEPCNPALQNPWNKTHGSTLE